MGTVESRKCVIFTVYISMQLAMGEGGQVQKQAGRLQQALRTRPGLPSRVWAAIVFGVGRTPADVAGHISSLLTGASVRGRKKGERERGERILACIFRGGVSKRWHEEGRKKKPRRTFRSSESWGARDSCLWWVFLGGLGWLYADPEEAGGPEAPW